jgi:hypothetical protein
VQQRTICEPRTNEVPVPEFQFITSSTCPDIFFMWLKRQAIKMVLAERHHFPEDAFTAKIVFKEVFE